MTLTRMERHRLDKWDRDVEMTAAGWCAEDGCLHRVECFKGRPLRSPYCPIHQPKGAA